MTTLEELTEEIVAFRDDRDWEQFHTPKQLAAAISIEAAELQELFLWKNSEQVDAERLTGEVREDAEREIADVMIYALLFCNAVAVDPDAAIRRKLEENAEKYPVNHARGKADKYTDLPDS